ncbi:MAG: PQQ-binding-like beta-propeller repeat protein, partial [Verrucomicrobiales bacterium]|nr:PQQ-binding-like beta-propeller repeat protein [Verrucomicrobiales bacterium]
MKPVLVLLLATGTLSAAVPNWPQFRGPNASGVSEDGRPPIRFGPGSNQLWKVAVPAGISSPVVWGDHLFLTALENSRLLTLAYDTRDGRELWRRVAPTEQIEPCHGFSSPAASTACTDGE